MPTLKSSLLAAGGNRHPSAADWAPGLFAFGAGNNVAIVNHDDSEPPQTRGISALLTGHTDVVNAVQIWKAATAANDNNIDSDYRDTLVLSASADHSIRVWQSRKAGDVEAAGFASRLSLGLHSASVTTLATLPQAGLFVSASADATIGVWEISGTAPDVQHVQTIVLKPRVLPLACALWALDGGVVILAVAGTSSNIQLYVRASEESEFTLQATLSGHEGWIRSLDFTSDGAGDFLLASASQDKYIRLWRLRRSHINGTQATNGDAASTLPSVKKSSLSNRTQQIGNDSDCQYDVTFEALLIGHEDWIYTAKWCPIKPSSAEESPCLLSASADNSLALWRADETSGLWVCHTRLGEISSQKGSTTATGSTGGFWIGLWQPDGEDVVSLGRTGSWRRWHWNSQTDLWEQAVGLSGHTDDVRGLAWAPDGSYLLSTSADQTTRVFAEWKNAGREISWHEFARPQIHGYDLNCIAALTPHQFTSGADEKLLRVFNKPKAIAELLSNLSGTSEPADADLPDSANIPVLGLSNKAITANEDPDATENDPHDAELVADGVASTSEAITHRSPLSALPHPPLEDHLARQTLWPEHEKLYGHGYEISAVAATGHSSSPSSDNKSRSGGRLLATACKASSLDHAVIRLYDADSWREIRPPLAAHTLTVTALQFSPGDDARYLLSVGRDRQWVVWERSAHVSSTNNDEADGGFDTGSCHYRIAASNPKGHSRMLLDCSWAPASLGRVFATAGRDKSVKIWRMDESDGHEKTDAAPASRKVECMCTISATASVTAVAFALRELVDVSESRREKKTIWLAYGTEAGDVEIATIDCTSWSVVDTVGLGLHARPSKAVNVLRWRPKNDSASDSWQAQLAVGSEDCSVRIFDVVK